MAAWAIKGVFHFVYPGSTQHGAYEVEGSMDDERLLRLSAGEWILPSVGKVVPVGLAGFFSPQLGTYEGEIMHASCGTFKLSRLRTDVVPPESVVYFPGADGTPDQLQMPLRASGALVNAEKAAGHTEPTPRAQLQMLLNGVAGLVQEARAARKDAPPAPPMPPASPPPAEENAAPPAASPTASPAADDSKPAHVSEFAASIWSLFQKRHFSEAYDLWAGSCGSMAREERRSTAHSVVSRILERARDTLESPDRARSRAMHRDVLRALAVFGGRLRPVGRAIAAVLTSSDEAEADDSVFAESHLALALNRSGCRDDDELLELAEVHRRAGDVETARRHLTQLIARSPDWSYPFQRLGVLERDQGRAKEGVRLLRIATDLTAHDVFSWMELGHSLKALADTRGAIDAFREVQARHPTMMALRRMRQWLVAAEEQMRLAPGPTSE